jgi:hypothetical protein
MAVAGLVPLPLPGPEDGAPAAVGADRVARCAARADIGDYTCQAFARSEAPADSLGIALIRGPVGDQYVSHAALRYSTLESRWHDEGGYVHGDPDAPAPELPNRWPPLPGEGEPFGDAWPVLAELVVEPGSRLSAPPYVTECATGGSFAILEVTGDRDAVMAGYADQISAYVGEAAERTEPRRFGDALVELVTGSEAGGYHYAVTLVQREGRPPWLTVDGCND